MSVLMMFRCSNKNSQEYKRFETDAVLTPYQDMDSVIDIYDWIFPFIGEVAPFIGEVSPDTNVNLVSRKQF